VMPTYRIAQYQSKSARTWGVIVVHDAGVSERLPTRHDRVLDAAAEIDRLKDLEGSETPTA
jgi:hypothetical protein